MNATQRGFGIIAAIVILVIMATLAAALVRLGTTQQITSVQDILSARAWQTARAGTEWGLYQALGPAASCTPATTLDLRAATGFSVTVTCAAKSFNEGETAPGVPFVTTTYSIEAVACNSASCPDAALVAMPGYVERKRLVVAHAP
jgi:MSHA biogenesis protein MshP